MQASFRRDTLAPKPRVFCIQEHASALHSSDHVVGRCDVSLDWNRAPANFEGGIKLHARLKSESDNLPRSSGLDLRTDLCAYLNFSFAGTVEGSSVA